MSWNYNGPHLASHTFIFFLWSILAVPGFRQTFTATVAETVDGDTFIVVRDDGRVTVQLHGLDAPEPTQTFGPSATRFVRRRIEGERVRIEVLDHDRYGRLIASVYHEGAELNQQLLRSGLAWYYWWYDRYTPDAARDQRLEYRAQTANRGLWQQSTPIPPWEWRDEDQGVAYATSGPTDLAYNPSGVPRSCDEFSTQERAQKFLEAALPSTVTELDPDGNQIACERFFSE